MFAVTLEEAVPLVIGVVVLAAVIVFPIVLSRKRIGHRARLHAERGHPDRGRSK